MANYFEKIQPVAYRNGKVFFLDQRLLPTETKWLEVDSVETCRDAIRRLVVRGAPAIGIAAAFGMLIASRGAPKGSFGEYHFFMKSAEELLATARPTAVNLFWALKRFARVETVCFSYGQRHVLEIEAAQAIAATASVPFHIIDASLIAGLSSNSLTDASIPMDREQTGNTPPNTFVPGRNMLFISIAAVFARERNIAHLITGVSQADYSGYPDCRDTFIRSLNVTLNLAMEEQFMIHTPLMWLNKAAVWRLADELGIFELVKSRTVTCYNGLPGNGCGECPSCKLRRHGLHEYEMNK